ncbi:hypothetical protein ABZ508_02670 [Streptomyces lavendulocolor]|uniref:Protein spdB n=1 Tax=Streptomyces lavendulocolor TaxID=67316 RepID=A0ABV2VY98_9ACTN
MHTTNSRWRRVPPILIGATLLAALSLAWSAYAITDLMRAGWFGLSVALAGDIAWITVLWAEYRGLTITVRGRTVEAAAVGLGIALGVAALLALHGHDEGSWGQGIAGPFVVLVGKAVWAYALASLRDPAALTSEQLAEIHDVMRQSEYTARLHHAQLEQLDRAADAEIARIKAEARITLARDDVDFEVTLKRINKRAEIERRTPLALGSPHVLGAAANDREHRPEQIASAPNAVAPNPPMNSANADREQPSMAAIVREQVARLPNNSDAVNAVMAIKPDANRESVAAAVRRARAKGDMKGGYA